MGGGGTVVAAGLAGAQGSSIRVASPWIVGLSEGMRSPGIGFALCSMFTAVWGSTILMTTWACSNAYASCGFCSNICRASFGLFCTHSFICFMSSNICSGGKEATALLMASGALSAWTTSPYGFSVFWPCNRLCISIRLFSVQALSTRSVRPPIS